MQAQTPTVTRPNIILVNSDQFRWDCVGAMGLNPMNLTPNLDRMARRGVLFRNAFVAQPVCAPARASILTGQYPAKHGVWRNAIGLRPDAVTLATELHRGRYPNPYIPPDLRTLPGSWPSQLADYYACVAKMDDCVGTIRKTLAETGLDRNTILVFTSDHACHFRTRNAEYKRSPHESSIHIPLIVEGPGFDRGAVVNELVSQVDFAPSLLSAAGLAAPASMQGRNFLPLLDRRTEGWRNEIYFEMAEYVTGRGLRTPQYTYAVMAPRLPGWRAVPGADKYVEYILYDNYADPAQHVNLAGRVPYQEVSQNLRGRLLARIREASGAAPTIEPCWFPYS